MDDSLQIPIKPINDSLEARIASLDLLSARLAALTNKTQWPVRVPVSSVASFKGKLIQTNNIKVCFGEDWWADLTAQEASEYATRRKQGMEHSIDI